MEITSWSIGHLLSTAARLNERHNNERLRSYGITHAGLILLKVLSRSGPISQAQLAGALHIKPPTLGKTVERLERLGLVRRFRGGRDKRLFLVELTAAGRDLLAALEAEEREFDESLGLLDSGLRAALENMIGSLHREASGYRPTTLVHGSPTPCLTGTVRTRGDNPSDVRRSSSGAQGRHEQGPGPVPLLTAP